jgi:hypothetical protein
MISHRESYILRAFGIVDTARPTSVPASASETSSESTAGKLPVPSRTSLMTGDGQECEYSTYPIQFTIERIYVDAAAGNSAVIDSLQRGYTAWLQTSDETSKTKSLLS